MYVQRRPQVEVGLEDVSTLKELFIVNQDLKKDFLSNIVLEKLNMESTFYVQLLIFHEVKFFTKFFLKISTIP